MENGSKAMEDLLEVMGKLLSPQGCPWDGNRPTNP